MKNLKLIWLALGDLLVRKLPSFKKKHGFAFLVHPRDVSDVLRKYPFLKKLSPKIIENILLKFWPVTVSEIDGVFNYFNGEKIRGWVISCPLTAEQMLKDRDLAKKFILKTAKLAEKKGASMIGLGALTASLTQGGLSIQEKIDKNTHLISGKVFTAKIVSDTTANIANELGLNKQKILVSVLGAAGSIGSASAQILAHRGFGKINLIDLSEKTERILKLENILKELNPQIEIIKSDSLSLLKDSDVIIAATNRHDALIKSEHLKAGAVVVDDAQPSDVDISILDNRKDVLILEGGAANMPGVNANFKFGLKNKDDIFSCLAEVILAATFNKNFYKNHNEMKLDFNILDEMEKLSAKININISQFQNSKKIYSREDIEYIKNLIK